MDVVSEIPKIQEIVADDLSFVAKTQDEVAYPVGPVVFHDVPKDRLVADWHHGFGLELGFLAEPRSESAAENDGLSHR